MLYLASSPYDMNVDIQRTSMNEMRMMISIVYRDYHGKTLQTTAEIIIQSCI